MKLSTYMGLLLIILGIVLLSTGLMVPNSEKETIEARNQEIVISNVQNSQSLWKNYAGIVCILGGSIFALAPLYKNKKKILSE